MSDRDKPEIDDVTGTATTGHEWDGIKELNTPLPRWWLNIFYATVAGSAVYWLLFPAWPLVTSHTPGLLGHSDRKAVVEEVGALKAMRAPMFEKLAATPLQQVSADPELAQFAAAAGEAAFGDNCAPCHGRGAQGSKGFPNLNDDDWIWGGTADEIRQTIAYGVRNGDERARMGGVMMAYGRDGVLTAAQISDVSEYVLKLSSQAHDEAKAGRGEAVFKEQCVACHNPDGGANVDDVAIRGKGNKDFGAPNLTDAVWLYGGDRASIVETIANGRQGQMPVWAGRLDDATISALAVYVHGLGGGR